MKYLNIFCLLLGVLMILIAIGAIYYGQYLAVVGLIMGGSFIKEAIDNFKYF